MDCRSRTCIHSIYSIHSYTHILVCSYTHTLILSHTRTLHHTLIDSYSNTLIHSYNTLIHTLIWSVFATIVIHTQRSTHILSLSLSIGIKSLNIDSRQSQSLSHKCINIFIITSSKLTILNTITVTTKKEISDNE